MTADVLAVAEHRRGELRDVSFEVVTAARRIVDDTGGDLHLAVIGGDVDAFADRLSLSAVDRVLTVDEGEEFDHGVYTQALAALYDHVDPQYVVAPNTVNGLDYAPAVAERLDLPLVTDATAVGAGDGLTVTREMYGSKVETTVEMTEEPFTVSVRGGEWPAAGAPVDPPVESFAFDLDENAVRSRVTGFAEVGGGDVDTAGADFLVSVGRGVEEKNSELIEEPGG